MSLEITSGPWGNCPVQAEGTFDGENFYFRARGTSVTCEVGEGWMWQGPEYEWPAAGWISKELATEYIKAAYREWHIRSEEQVKKRHELIIRNDRRSQAMAWSAIMWELEKELGAEATAAVEYLRKKAQKMWDDAEITTTEEITL